MTSIYVFCFFWSRRTELNKQQKRLETSAIYDNRWLGFNAHPKIPLDLRYFLTYTMTLNNLFICRFDYTLTFKYSNTFVNRHPLEICIGKSIRSVWFNLQVCKKVDYNLSILAMYLVM